MKIAFWSNARGHSGVTSNLACISVLSALSCPNERTIVFENHKNIVNLGSTYYHPQSAGCVRNPCITRPQAVWRRFSISGKRRRTFRRKKFIWFD